MEKFFWSETWEFMNTGMVDFDDRLIIDFEEIFMFSKPSSPKHVFRTC